MEKKQREILRLITAGSVDDGKSTLIGRLLYDSKAINKNDLDHIKASSEKKGMDTLDLSMITDGLRAEREQGITIDVAYRYFSTDKRKFIIADTPGHIQFTRNMITGASNSNLAIILIDARKGITEQTRRHSFIASLLQIHHIVVCINKMDLVEYDEQVYNEIVEEYETFSARLSVKDIRYIPISALHGDNVVEKSNEMKWFLGSPLLNTLNTIHIASDHNYIDMRFPVQTVIRPKSETFHDFRGYAGSVASGTIRIGDDIKILPSGMISKIRSIYDFQTDLEEAFPPMAITITLEDEVDVSRGDLIVNVNNNPEEIQELDVLLCWLHSSPSTPKAKYLIKHTTRELMGMISEIVYKINVNTLRKIDQQNEDEGATRLQMNDIARVKIRTAKPLFIDKYSTNRIMGSLILVDSQTNETVAAAVIK